MLRADSALQCAAEPSLQKGNDKMRDLQLVRTDDDVLETGASQGLVVASNCESWRCARRFTVCLPIR